MRRTTTSMKRDIDELPYDGPCQSLLDTIFAVFGDFGI